MPAPVSKLFDTLKDLLSASNPGLVMKEDLAQLEDKVEELEDLVGELEDALERSQN